MNCPLNLEIMQKFLRFLRLKKCCLLFLFPNICFYTKDFVRMKWFFKVVLQQRFIKLSINLSNSFSKNPTWMPYPSTESHSPLQHFILKKKLNSSKYPIYEALDSQTNTSVVIKFFPISNGVSLYFRKEQIYFQTLQHTNVIQLYDYQEEAPAHPELRNQGIERNSDLILENAYYGDLFEIINKAGPIPEKLCRTLFQKILDVLDFFHSKKIAHMDLKLENILIDENLTLKLTDFDLSQTIGDIFLENRGTPGTRAPEVKEGTSKDYIAADIYSLGVILFTMLSALPPYTEVDKGGWCEFDPFYKLMRANPEKFWAVHAKFKGDETFYSQEIIDLISSMLAENPVNRPTSSVIRNHMWFLKPILTESEYHQEMANYLSSIYLKG